MSTGRGVALDGAGWSVAVVILVVITPTILPVIPLAHCAIAIMVTIPVVTAITLILLSGWCPAPDTR